MGTPAPSSSTSSSGVAPGRRVRRSGLATLLLVVAAALVAGLLSPSPATADPRPTPVGAVRAPAAGDDFPRLPGRCYLGDRTTIRPGPCYVTDFGKRRPTLVLWGDSHAWMYLPVVRKLAKKRRVNLVTWLMGGCPVAKPMHSARQGRGGCEKQNVAALAYLKRLKRADVRFGVLVNSFWSGYAEGYRRLQRERAGGPSTGLTDYQEEMSVMAVRKSRAMFKALGRTRIDIDLVAQAATVPYNARPCPAGNLPYQCSLPRNRAMNGERSNRRWFRELMAPLAGRPRLVDPSPLYCTSLVCKARVGAVNTYYDDIHLGARLTGRMTRWFRPVFDDLR